MKIQTKKLTYEDRFARRFCCWTYNHGGWTKAKRENRQALRRKIKRGFYD